MSPKKHPTIWPADPHTIAKIKLLERYLQAWFAIMGRAFPGRRLTYIDGFAGPGEYTNLASGSPVVAVNAPTEALRQAGSGWRAGTIDLAFVELDKARHQNLEEKLAAMSLDSRVRMESIQGAFSDSLALVRTAFPNAFLDENPLLAFVDPFGPTAAPFSAIQSILSSTTSEVILNLDADGIARIHRYQSDANRDNLRDIFGDEEWQIDLSADQNFDSHCRRVLRAYRDRLFAIEGVRYVYPFEMRDGGNRLSYFLVFVSRHPFGMLKMKEAMRSVGQNGGLSFSDAWTGRLSLFRDDDPEAFVPDLQRHFDGRSDVQWWEINDYVLNETPFLNPKALLKTLEKRQDRRLVVDCSVSRRKKNTYPDDLVETMVFSFARI